MWELYSLLVPQSEVLAYPWGWTSKHRTHTDMYTTLTSKRRESMRNHIMWASTPCHVQDRVESCKISVWPEQSVKVNAFLICRDSHGVAAVRTCSASSDSECRLQRYEQKAEPPSDSESFFDEERKYSLYTPIGRRCQRHQIGVASHTAVPLGTAKWLGRR